MTQMWDQIAPGHVLQVRYYRYLTFSRDGQCRYMMAPEPPEPSQITKLITTKLPAWYTGEAMLLRRSNNDHDDSHGVRGGTFSIRKENPGLCVVVRQSKSMKNIFTFEPSTASLWPTKHSSAHTDGTTSQYPIEELAWKFYAA